MKKLINTFACILTVLTVTAQPPHRDTIGGGVSLTPWQREVLQVPVLLTPTNAKTFTPTQKICFDKKIHAKATTGSSILEMYIFINTVDGIAGLLTGKEGTLGDGNLNTEDPHFRFMMIGKKGNVYTYYNTKKKNVIEHYVQTGNSQTYLTVFRTGDPSARLNKKTERNMFCGDKFKTWGYKAEGDAPVFHLFGGSYPVKLEAKDFIGYSGVGYLRADAGIYISCKMEKGSFFTEMREFDDVSVCFDPALFKHAEQEMVTEATQKLQEQKEKLDSKTFSGDCVAQKEALNNFKKEMVKKKQEQLQQTQRGNAYQDKNVQQAYANLTAPEDAIDEGMLDLDVKMCKLQEDISKASSKGQNTSSRQEKLQCYTSQKSSMQSAKTEMQALNTRYRNEPGKAYSEKMKIMGRVMTNGCN